MRYLVMLVGVAFLAGTVALNAAKKSADFSGTLVLNTEKSELGDQSSGRRGGMPAAKLVVTQKDNNLTVESFRKDQDGNEVSMSSTYTLDGIECKNGDENRKSVSTAVWSADGMLLTITSDITMSRNGQDFTMKMVEKWSLGDGMLTVDGTRTTQRGERTTKAVYNKS